MKRKHAIAAGLTEYFGDKACPRAHTGLRHITRGCIECERERSAGRYSADPEAKRKQVQARYQTLTPEQKSHTAATQAQWRRDNPERCQEFKDKAKAKYHHQAEARPAKVTQSQDGTDRPQARLAMPAWANRREIKKFYDKAKALTESTGVQHGVDHVIPLTGDIVWGLHVENNLQVLTQSQNSTKGKSFHP